MPARKLALLVLLVAACHRKDDAADAGANAPSAGAVKYTTGLPQSAGIYDGTKALVVTVGTGTQIFIPRACPTFSCADLKPGGASLDPEKIKKACPTAQFLVLGLKSVAAPGAKTSLASAIHLEVAHGASNGVYLDSADPNELEVLPAAGLVGHVRVKGMESIDGIISATPCPTSP